MNYLRDLSWYLGLLSDVQVSLLYLKLDVEPLLSNGMSHLQGPPAILTSMLEGSCSDTPMSYVGVHPSGTGL